MFVCAFANNNRQLLFNDWAFCLWFQRQWTKNGGKCGVCGDAYDLPPPRPNEDGGVFGKGILIRTYRSGDVIDAIVNLTANHKGWMEFRLCRHDNDDHPVTQHCLNKHLLRIVHNSVNKRSTKRLYVGDEKLISMKIKLPHNFFCRKCVLQWKYNAGNNPYALKKKLTVTSLLYSCNCISI